MSLLKSVSVERRFQRSIRIDTDLNDPSALQGFVCPASSAAVLESMSNHLLENQQAAFTWTGPYGSGKSSLVIALSALLSGNKEIRKEAEKSLGKDCAKSIFNAFNPSSKGWKIVPVVGQRASTSEVIGEELVQSGAVKNAPKNGWTDASIVKALQTASKKDNRDGVIVFIDEMGKFLEATAKDGEDIYLFQLLAEAATRSNNRLVIVGILHQSFQEYAGRLSRDIRDEWSKVQGRFVDLAVNTAGEEQIDLLARAIHSKHKAVKPSSAALEVAKVIRQNKPGVSSAFEQLLEDTWPLHPAVTSLLGPISRRRFGQNQRSLFGFLNSAEPYGFQEFLATATDGDLYLPTDLWTYLKINLEPAIMSSPDGHRWAIAAEAVERCEAVGNTQLSIDLLKTIAVLDLFRQQSGLQPCKEVLYSTVDAEPKEIDEALEELRSSSFIIYRSYLDSFAIFAGSDFDIEEALDAVTPNVQTIELSRLQGMAGVQPLLAKQHYFKTGSLRWFDVQLTTLEGVADNAASFEVTPDLVGKYLLALPNEEESQEQADEVCKEASIEAGSQKLNVIIGYPLRSWKIAELIKEIQALELIRESRPEIQGDQIAQREIDSRTQTMQSELESELQQAMVDAVWYENGEKLERVSIHTLNNKVSIYADQTYPHTPKILNELLNRFKPSGSAVGGQNALMRAMALNLGEERLGIEGYPVHGGLFESLLLNTGLYQKIKDNEYDFIPPTQKKDPANLYEAWDVASNHLEENSDRAVGLDEIYELWGSGTLGIKRGLMPILSVAFILSKRDVLAFYREGIFQPHFTDLEVDYLSKDPASIQIRWMDLSQLSKTLLSGLAGIVRELDEANPLTELEPIDVARGIIAIFDALPNWTKRTQEISAISSKFRTVLRHANDPNQLLFTDLPNAYKEGVDLNDETEVNAIISQVRNVLKELEGAYTGMLGRVRDILLIELHVPNETSQALEELRERAKNIQHISGDFRLDAFVNRLSEFDGSEESIEGIGSLAASKPPKNWVDTDLNKSLIEVAELAQKFVRTETFARVQGRESKRESIAVIVTKEGTAEPLQLDFAVTEYERPQINEVAEKLKQTLINNDISEEILLAALAQVSGELIESVIDSKPKAEEI